MSKLVKGIHHAAVKCMNGEEFEKVVSFYTKVLGMEIARAWGEGDGRGIMIDTGRGLLEIFASGKTMDKTGTVNHFALATDDVDACIAAVRAYGCKVTLEATDICIPAAVPFPARIAFCVGPAGEEIEFFCEK